MKYWKDINSKVYWLILKKFNSIVQAILIKYFTIGLKSHLRSQVNPCETFTDTIKHAISIEQEIFNQKSQSFSNEINSCTSNTLNNDNNSDSLVDIPNVLEYRTFTNVSNLNISTNHALITKIADNTKSKINEYENNKTIKRRASTSTIDKSKPKNK